MVTIAGTPSKLTHSSSVQPKNRVLGNARHADDSIDARFLHEGRYDLDALYSDQTIHYTLNVLHVAVQANMIIDFVLLNAVQYAHEAKK